MFVIIKLNKNVIIKKNIRQLFIMHGALAICHSVRVCIYFQESHAERCNEYSTMLCNWGVCWGPGEARDE